MIVELVHTKTSDGLRLHGALQTPDTAIAADTPPTTVDAVVLTHGVGSNFYSSIMMQSISDALRQLGIATLRVNTRGHDGVSTASTDNGGVLQGAAFEIVDHCRMDLAAWTEFLVARGHQRIAWLGHSLGAIKVVYAQAFQPHPAVVQLIAISPPRLAHSRLAKGPGSLEFQNSWREANRLMDAQQPTMLFQATFPFPLVLSAGTFCDKYGPKERYNLLKFIDQVQVPVTLLFGQLELESGNVAFDQFQHELADADWPVRPNIQVIQNANHFYSGCLSELLQAVEAAVKVNE